MFTNGMGRPRHLLVISVLTAVGIELQAAAGPELGESVSPGELAAWGTVIMPDGEGLPPGRGSVNEGRELYAARCLSCHGPDGVGDSADRLAGAGASLTGDWPEKTVGNYWPYATTLFDFVQRAMPISAPGSLSASETYALVAYLLHLNGLVPADAVLDRERLPRVQMPNRDGFLPIMD